MNNNDLFNKIITDYLLCLCKIRDDLLNDSPVIDTSFATACELMILSYLGFISIWYWLVKQDISTFLPDEVVNKNGLLLIYVQLRKM